MLIDWFTVGAQLLNFLILVWLMRRYLYQPILDAIDAREKRIAAELADADAKKAEAKKERDEFQQKNTQFEQQRDALLNQAKTAANDELQRLHDEARQKIDVLNKHWHESMLSDADATNQAISLHVQQEVFAITAKVLGSLAAVSLEQRIIEVFILRLREMEDAEKNSLKQAIETTSTAVLVRSAFNLDEQQHAAIQQALNEIFSAEINIEYKTAPDLVSGIELMVNGQKLAWNIADYMASLESSVKQLLSEKSKTNNTLTEAKAKPE
jgi:F-type H+-transporting ATPase subunit b